MAVETTVKNIALFISNFKFFSFFSKNIVTKKNGADVIYGNINMGKKGMFFSQSIKYEGTFLTVYV